MACCSAYVRFWPKADIAPLRSTPSKVLP